MTIEQNDLSTIEGEVASRVFQAFKDGMPPVDVVIALKLPPGAVWSLHRKYRQMVLDTRAEEEPEG